jgi:putative MFS transporter
MGAHGLVDVPIGSRAFVSFFVVRLTDRVGRRPLLLISLFGYALFTGLTAISPNVWTFALSQSLGQIFLGAEFAFAVLLISEEVEPELRGLLDVSRELRCARIRRVACTALLD